MIDTISMHAEHRRSFDRKIQVMLDQVTGVALGYKPGLFLYGAGGIGKSYSVLNHLEKLEESVILYNSRITAKGLFLSLKDAPDAIHLLEDVERLTKDADAQGVLVEQTVHNVDLRPQRRERLEATAELHRRA